MYEEQHPIPQDVTTYQFRLVGDMTLKQFFQVAAGVLVALFFYSSNLAFYIKWPLILVSFLFGLALAFFPVEDRPLSKWIMLFFMSIYSPTIYVWKKTEIKPNYFAPETVQPLVQLPDVPSQQTMPSPSVQIAQNMVNQTTEEKKLEKSEEVFLTNVSSQFVNPQPAIQTNSASKLDVKTDQQSIPSRSEAQIPTVTPVVVERKDHQTEIPNEQTVYNAQTNTHQQTVITPSASRTVSPSIAATYSQTASPPTPPQKPNIIVGQVLSNQGSFVEGAILEVFDEQKRSVRALRTNRLGHFMIVTPLPSGQYTITTEKEGFVFDPIEIEAKNQIIPPILIQGK